jgi:nitroreductase
MHTGIQTPRLGTADVHAAVALAVRAPSIHNTQPWRWVSGRLGLDLYADRHRQLPVVDPDGRALLVSCGAALWLARLSLDARGWPTSVQRFPDADQPDLLARITVGAWAPPAERTRALAAAAKLRRTERRPFRADPVPDGILDELCRLLPGPEVYASHLQRPDDRRDLAVAMSWANGLENDNEAYRAELARWVRPDAVSAGVGIPPSAVPHLAPGQQRHSDVPVRDFEVARDGDQDVAAVDEHPGWVVLFSAADDPEHRLLAGEAFGHLSVQATRMGLASSAATQAVDLPGVRDRIRVLMNWPDHAQMIVRIGWPPAGDPAPPTPRRGVADVLQVSADQPAG